MSVNILLKALQKVKYNLFSTDTYNTDNALILGKSAEKRAKSL